MRLVALVALRCSSRSGQRDGRPLQIQCPGGQYVHDLHSMDIYTFIPAHMPAVHGEYHVGSAVKNLTQLSQAVQQKNGALHQQMISN